ncbi:uncharacterized protein LOC120317577 isoform X2 [Crotalus tigris]|uniref:uncharacterized protein LOC120317577 isoform X2 n=1 Tax=Crotalus tigris TaxID=88082 RepID=UPI00192F253B|nr:uncharacterized protein LOC120317577 isoform X2 [Crotalus tigris]
MRISAAEKDAAFLLFFFFFSPTQLQRRNSEGRSRAGTLREMRRRERGWRSSKTESRARLELPQPLSASPPPSLGKRGQTRLFRRARGRSPLLPRAGAVCKHRQPGAPSGSFLAICQRSHFLLQLATASAEEAACLFSGTRRASGVLPPGGLRASGGVEPIGSDPRRLTKADGKKAPREIRKPEKKEESGKLWPSPALTATIRMKRKRKYGSCLPKDNCGSFKGHL